MMKLTLTVLAVVLATISGQKSPCPNVFQYNAIEKGSWNGNLNLLTEYTLYGTWIRLIFDAPIKDLEVNVS